MKKYSLFYCWFCVLLKKKKVYSLSPGCKTRHVSTKPSSWHVSSRVQALPERPSFKGTDLSNSGERIQLKSPAIRLCSHYHSANFQTICVIKSLDWMGGIYTFIRVKGTPLNTPLSSTYPPEVSAWTFTFERGRCLWISMATPLLLLVNDEQNTCPTQSCFNLACWLTVKCVSCKQAIWTCSFFR